MTSRGFDGAGASAAVHANAGADISAYMDKFQIKPLLRALTSDVVRNKPADPVKHLQQLLKEWKARKVLIAGAPASGKGTQCELIVEMFGLSHISTGDLLRAAVKAGTPLGKEAKGFMDSGQLVPDDLIIGMVKDRLAEKDVAHNGWLLDGFPRTKAQAEALDAIGVTPDIMVFLDVPDEILEERVTGRVTDPVTGKVYHNTFNPPPKDVVARCTQRSDDTAEKVRERLRHFHSNLDPILSHYSALVTKVDGARGKLDVFRDIKAALK